MNYEASTRAKDGSRRDKDVKVNLRIYDDRQDKKWDY